MPFCNNCGKQIDEQDKFCLNCGKPNKSLSQNSAKDIPLRAGTIESKSGSYGASIDNNPGTVIENSGSYGLDVSNLPVDTVIDNRYKVIKKLGAGGFGTVYKVWDENMDVHKALKVIHSEIYNDKEAIEKLKREAKLLYKLKHPNIVEFHDIHLQGDIKYFDMELISGGDLVDLKLKHRTVTEDIMLPIMKKIIEGMIKIHDSGIIHKDLKPANIMLTDDGIVKIMDFGISETLKTSMSRLSETSRSGTAVYQSPEHLNGKMVGKESDIWSFGVLCYEMLSGNPVFRGDSWDDVKSSIKGRLDIDRDNGKLKQFGEIESLDGISDKLNSLLGKCLRWDYKERFRNFAEIDISIPDSEKTESTLDEIFISYKYKKHEILGKAASTDFNEFINHYYTIYPHKKVIQVGFGEEFESINDAVDKAEAGDVIVISPGFYYEKIVLNKSVLLIGDNSKEDVNIVSEDDYCIEVKCQHTMIINLNLSMKSRDDRSCLSVNYGSLLMSNCNIQNKGGNAVDCYNSDILIYKSKLHNLEYDGVHLGKGTKAIVEDCEIYECGSDGIACSQTSSVKIKNCKIHDVGAIGITIIGYYDYELIDNCLTDYVTECEVINCEIYNIGQDGFFITNGSIFQINKCRVSDTMNHGMNIDKKVKGIINECEIYKNKIGISSIGIESSIDIVNCKINNNFEHGICHSGTGERKIIDCIITENGEDGISIGENLIVEIKNSKVHHMGANGIWLSGSNVNIIDCEISKNTGYGIYVDPKSKAVIDDCRIHDMKDIGIYNPGDGNCNITKCDIFNNELD